MCRCEVFVDLFSVGETIDVNDLFRGCGGVGVMRQLSLTMEPMMSRSRTERGHHSLLAAGEQLHGGQ
jgi:ribosomal protein L3